MKTIEPQLDSHTDIASREGTGIQDDSGDVNQFPSSQKRSNKDSNKFASENKSPKTECTHCGLEVPKGLIDKDKVEQFCCHGCRTAYSLITECQLDDFYRLADIKKAVPDHGPTEFDEFDSDYFLQNHAPEIGASGERSLRRVVFAIDGLHCSACLWLIEKLPRICPGVAKAIVNWNSQSVTITFDSQKRLSEIAGRLADLGYFPTVFEADSTSKRSRLENRRSLFDLGLAGAAAGNNMLVALALYLGQFYGMTAAVERLLVFYSGLISLVSVFGPGRKILAKAVSAVRTRTPHMDLPVALGITVGLVAGWINLLTGSSSVFFDSISVLIFVLLLGRYIQQIQQRAAIEKLSLVNRLLPRFCKRLINATAEGGEQKEEKVSIEQIRAGDRVVVERGEVIPIDGLVTLGQASVDQSILTGESFPEEVPLGSQVYAGTLNLKESIQIEACKPAQESRIATIFQDVEESVRRKTRIVQFADRIGAWFVLAVLILAAVTFFVWLSDPMFAANAAVAVLIVACPCALALATPVAISVALSSALKNRILIKDGDAFERLTKCRTIWFDKTGTLTQGRLKVTEWRGEDYHKRLVIALESNSGHPVAQAIYDSLISSYSDSEISAVSSMEIVELIHFSNGISANVEGVTLVIGSRRLMEDKQIAIAEEFQRYECQMLENGWSPVFVAAEGQVVAVMSIGDQLRESAAAVIEKLSAKHHVGILSGDRRQIVDRVARKLGIDPDNCHAELTPQQKSKLIADSIEPMMVGDGVNDSSALAEASVGIAINDRLDLNSRIAPIVLRGDQLDQIPTILTASDRVMRLIYRNISISLLYNVIAVSLAISGYIHPVIAAIFMPISSMTILLVSLMFNPFSKRNQS